MPVEFVGKEIEVQLSEDALRRPTAFRLGARHYQVVEVLTNWQDHGFGTIKPHLRDWQRQHHRNFYRVRTSEGDIFEIYADWMASRRQRKNRPERTRWYAYRRIYGREEAAPPETPSEEPQE